MKRITKLMTVKLSLFTVALLFACAAWSQEKTWEEYRTEGVPERAQKYLKGCKNGNAGECRLMAQMFEPPEGSDVVQSEYFNRKACIAVGENPIGWDMVVARNACPSVGLPIPESTATNTIEKRKKAISDVLDEWFDAGRGIGLYRVVEALDDKYAQVLTGSYGTDYRELELNADELKDLPAIGLSFLKNRKSLRDIEKSVATLYLAALSVGGEAESIHGTSRWSTDSTEELGEGALTVQGDSAYDWRYKLKMPLGVAAYLAGSTLLNDPEYRNNPDLASWAYQYLWLARMNGVQDAAFLLNTIYDSGYGVPKHHLEPDPLEAAWFRFHHVVYVCETYFNERSDKHWLERHPLPPRQGSCEKAQQELRAAKEPLDQRKNIERQAKAALLLGVLAEIGEMLPDTPYQPASGNNPINHIQAMGNDLAVLDSLNQLP